MKTIVMSLFLTASMLCTAHAAQVGTIQGQKLVLLDTASAEALFATVSLKNSAAKEARVKAIFAAVKNDKSATSFCNLAKSLHGRLRPAEQIQDKCEQILGLSDVIESVTTADPGDFHNGGDLNYKVSAMIHMMFLL